MITAGYCRVMARYNRWQNASLIEAAEGLDEAARQADRGAFFGSIHGTLSHLLWADTIWMSRFDGGAPPGVGIPDSPGFAGPWPALCDARARMDARILDWAGTLDDAALDATLSWYSGALGRDMEKPISVCIAHFFNHQTHHRGQAHAKLTAAGARPEDTDLFAMEGL